MIKNLLISIVALCFTQSVLSNATISLNSLNYPVWLDRDQQKIPLAPGAELLPDDVIHTGKEGRAWLSMQDGSVVKLGQNAQFKIKSASFGEKNGENLLKATVNILRGAFRYTSGFFRSTFSSSHEVNFQFGTFTAGIRGTDIWGRSNEDEEFLVLLEGAVEIETEDDEELSMTQPRSTYLKKTGNDGSLTTMDTYRVEELSKETELSPIRGIASIDGEYDLILMSLQNPELIEYITQHFKQKGYAISTQIVDIDNKKFTRLLLPGFVSREDANHLSKHLADEFQLQSVWVKKHSF